MILVISSVEGLIPRFIFVVAAVVSNFTLHLDVTISNQHPPIYLDLEPKSISEIEWILTTNLKHKLPR